MQPCSTHASSFLVSARDARGARSTSKGLVHRIEHAVESMYDKWQPTRASTSECAWRFQLLMACDREGRGEREEDVCYYDDYYRNRRRRLPRVAHKWDATASDR